MIGEMPGNGKHQQSAERSESVDDANLGRIAPQGQDIEWHVGKHHAATEHPETARDGQDQDVAAYKAEGVRKPVG